MEIYKKILKARLELQKTQLKKRGENLYSDYRYFELGDFIPKLNELSVELGFICLFNSDSESASLTIINTDDTNEQIVFSCPMSTAKLKAAHDVQNLGAVQTYLKRYLYQHAFEIVESDILDATHNAREEPKQENKTAKKSPMDALKSELAKAKTSDDVFNISSRFASAMSDGRIIVTKEESDQAKNLINARMNVIDMGEEK